MRKLLLYLSVVLLACACAAPPSLPPTTIAMVQFVDEIKVAQPISVAVDMAGRVYAGQRDGSVVVASASGESLITIPARNAAGKVMLRKPTGIAVAGERIFIVDGGQGLVAVYGTDGRFIESFGKAGSGLKQFSSPQGIAVQDGIIYVADGGNSRVQIFDQSGVFLGVVDGVKADDDPMKEQARLQRPVDVAIDYRGRIFVVDSGDKSVKIYDQTGEYLGRLPELAKPVGITIASDGIYVADGGSYSVKKFGFDLAFRLTFGSRGKGRAQFAGLEAVAVDHQGRVYVADRRKGLLHVFKPDRQEGFSVWQKEAPRQSVSWRQNIGVATLKTAWNGKDTLYAVDGKSILLIRGGKVSETITIEGLAPVSVAIGPAGAVWVIDKRQKRVVKLDEKGAIVLSFGNKGRGAGELRQPTDIALSSSGIIFVADPGSDLVQAYNNDGVFLNGIGEGLGGVRLADPRAIDIAPDDTLYVLDGESATIFSYGPDGKALAAFGGTELTGRGFDKPVDLAATSDEVFVLDRNNSAILVFASDGKLSRRFACAGKGKGDLRSPAGLTALDNITLYISDHGNKRIQVLDNVYAPATPVDLAVVAGMRVAELSWSANRETYVERYRVFRSESEDGPYLSIAEVDGPAFADHQVEPEKSYYYRVAALARKGRASRPSRMVSAVPAKFKPSPPVDLQATAGEWSVNLSWRPCKENFVTGYRVYRQKAEKVELLGDVTEAFFKEGGLASNSEYVYLVSAVSSDGEESDQVRITTTTRMATKAPLEIDVVDMQNVFSNTYKKYENDGIGRLRVTNNTGVTIEGIKISFTIKDFMDFPSETKIEALPPGESFEFVLKAVFNNNILTVTEDTPVQTAIEASYYEDEQLRKFIQSHPINIYEKHRMMWDDRRQFATFITPKDPVLIEFVRSVAAQYRGDDFSMQRSAAVFGALGVLGLTYIPDPSNPYQITSGRTDFVDYIQYPQETLQRKSGDCDDLVALYTSALESLGMRTKVIEVPGHMLMMFSTGMEAGADTDTMDNLFVIHEGQLWVVVETTMVGSSFIKAWEKGSETYYKWLDKGLTLLDIREAWSEFKPASLPSASWRPAFVERKAIDEEFNDEFSTLKRIGLRLKSQPFRERFVADPSDLDAALQIGIIYGRAGETDDALRAFEKVLEIDPQQVAALNNIGNLHLIEERYAEACIAYEKATAIEPDDAMLWINLARCNLQLKEKDKAREAFARAKEIDKSVVQKYRVLAMELMSAI